MQKVPNLELRVVPLPVTNTNLRDIRGHWVLIWAASLRCHLPYCIFIHTATYLKATINIIINVTNIPPVITYTLSYGHLRL